MQDKYIYKTTDKKLRKAMYEVFGGKCFYSGRPVPEDGFEVDHVVPRSKGGEDSVYNYVLASKDINRKKSDKQNTESITKILYIVNTVYAPAVLELLNVSTSTNTNIQYFIDKGCNEFEAKEINKWHVEEAGHSLEQAWLYHIYGGLFFAIQETIQEADNEELKFLQTEIKAMFTK